MAYVALIVCVVLIVMAVLLTDPDFRQGYRNSKFIDEVMDNEQRISDEPSPPANNRT